MKVGRRKYTVYGVCVCPQASSVNKYPVGVSTSIQWVCQQVSSRCVSKYRVGVSTSVQWVCQQISSGCVSGDGRLSLTIIAPKILASVVALVVVGKSTGKLGSAASL